MLTRETIQLQKVLNLLNLDDKIHEAKNPIEANISKGEIEFKNVSFSYDKKENSDSNKRVIKNLNLKIPAGKSVGIVGVTGSGKSTLMRLLYRFWDIKEG